MTAVRTAALISGASVAVVAAIGSYSHTQRLAAGHGETWLSYLLPLSVDGLLVVASLAMVRARRAGESPPGLAWFALVLGVLVSLVANVAAPGPDLVSKLVSAWPPLALAVAFELVVTLARPTSTSDTRANPQVTTVPTSAGDPTPADPPTQEATPDAPNLETQIRQILTSAQETHTRPPGRRAIAHQLDAREHDVRLALQAIRQPAPARLVAVPQ